jgi:hypothetical protein
MIKEISGFSLMFEDPTIDKLDQTKGVLTFNNKNTGLNIHGNHIDSQFETKNYYLLFVTENIMEEHLRIYLLNREHDEIDCIEMFTMYSPADAGLDSIKIISENELLFSFQNPVPWKLTILAKPRRYLFALSPYCITRRNKHLWNNVYMTVTH